jgi:hypothetical protein
LPGWMVPNIDTVKAGIWMVPRPIWFTVKRPSLFQASR